jgi:hypothetical protein
VGHMTIVSRGDKTFIFSRTRSTGFAISRELQSGVCPVSKWSRSVALHCGLGNTSALTLHPVDVASSRVLDGLQRP